MSSSHLSITAFCQACGAKHAFDPAVVGKKARCLKCGHTFVVPALGPQAAPTAALQHTAPAPAVMPGESPPGPRLQPVERIVTGGGAPDVTKIPPRKAAPASPSLPKVHDEPRASGLDPLHELAHAETAPRRRVRSQELGTAPEPIAVVREPTVDPKAALTAFGVMQGLFYLAVVAVIIVLLEAFIGLVLTAWAVLPIAVVYGKKIVMRILFLLTGRAATG